jgi:murein DD-endopeptidase MepM/ murein hydrolase activator NlpD
MPNPMSLMSGGGGGMSAGAYPQQSSGQTVNRQRPEPDFQPLAMGVGQQRQQFEQQRQPQMVNPIVVAQNSQAPTEQLIQQMIQQSSSQPSMVRSTPQMQNMNAQSTQSQQLLNAVFPTASQRITSQFGSRTAPMPGATTFHQGVDIGGNAGDPLKAIFPGKILQVGNNSGLGNYMKMLGDNGMTFTYGHANNFNVKPGQQVTAGQQIGAMGSTGISTGNHLHFMSSQNGKYFDPMTLFKNLNWVQ